MTSVASSKYADRSSRTASGSRPSDSAVNPTRSANSTVTRRRSATGASAGGVTPAEGGTLDDAGDPASCDPHSPQNRAVGGFDVPQLGHATASRAPHSPQNLRPASLGVPQLAQFTGVTGPSWRARVTPRIHDQPGHP